MMGDKAEVNAFRDWLANGSFEVSPEVARILTAMCEATDDLLWHVCGDGKVHVSVMCSDTFEYATADAEDIEPGDLDLLERCARDLPNQPCLIAPLFAARKRGLRPMEAWLDRWAFEDGVHHFDEIGEA